MRRLFALALLAATFTPVAAAQEFKPIPNSPVKGLVETLRAAGNFKTFLSLLDAAGGAGALGLAPVAPGKLASAGPGGGPHTLLVPNDAAFAKLPKGTVEALRKDPQRLRSFLLAHVAPGKLTLSDMLVPVGDGSTNTLKEIKSVQGRVLGFSCNGHTGEHHPRVNGGAARIGRGDIMFDGGVAHEIDAVLITDGTSH